MTLVSTTLGTLDVVGKTGVEPALNLRSRALDPLPKPFGYFPKVVRKVGVEPTLSFRSRLLRPSPKPVRLLADKMAETERLELSDRG